MKNRRAIIVILFVLLALPIPLSLLSWVWTLVSIVGTGITYHHIVVKKMQMCIALISMLLAGTYPITYLFSLMNTWKKKTCSVISFLPLLHIVLFIIVCWLALYLEGDISNHIAFNIANQSIYKDTPLQALAEAVKNQDKQKIAKLIEQNPGIIDYQDLEHEIITILSWAVRTRKYDAVVALLEAGANPNALSFGMTPLHYAAGNPSILNTQANEDAKFVNLLLKYGADPNIGTDNKTPLMRSIGQGIAKTKALVDAGADINFRTGLGMTAVIQALTHVDSSCSREMLEYAHYLIVEKKADVTSYKEFALENYLRNWICPLGTDCHRLKMEIVEEFARQGVDYWSTEITKRQLEQIKKTYPDTWEEYIKGY